MSSRREYEAPLSEKEVAQVLAICSPEGLLVGGQALAFWANRLGVPLPADLESGVTADVDFIGGSALAKALGEALGWKTWLPTLDDVTPKTGKVTSKLPDGGIKQVDFLSGVIGLTTKDIGRRAAELDIPSLGHIRVMHPIDVLDSRIQNLHALREKRNAMGIAQARLAIEVAREYVKAEIAEQGERAALKLVERVVEIAQESAGLRVYLRYGIDPLQAIPTGDFRTTPAFHGKRWPQVVRETNDRRETLRTLQGRSAARARRRKAPP